MSVLGAGVFCLVFPSSSSLLCWAAPALPLLFEPFVTSLSLLLPRALSLHNYRDGLVKIPTKPRLRDLISTGKIHIGEPIFTKKQPSQIALIIDGDTVEYQGEKLPINTWGQRMTGWSSISIYNSVFVVRTGQPLKNLREQEIG